MADPTRTATMLHRPHTLHSLHTKYNADSVEFMPLEADGDDAGASAVEAGARSRTLVCGNSQLNEATRDKIGRIYLYQLEAAAASGAADSSSDAAAVAASPASASASASAAAAATAQPAYSLVEQQVLETAAIFDLKW